MGHTQNKCHSVPPRNIVNTPICGICSEISASDHSRDALPSFTPRYANEFSKSLPMPRMRAAPAPTNMGGIRPGNVEGGCYGGGSDSREQRLNLLQVGFLIQPSRVADSHVRSVRFSISSCIFGGHVRNKSAMWEDSSSVRASAAKLSACIATSFATLTSAT